MYIPQWFNQVSGKLCQELGLRITTPIVLNVSKQVSGKPARNSLSLTDRLEHARKPRVRLPGQTVQLQNIY